MVLKTRKHKRHVSSRKTMKGGEPNEPNEPNFMQILEKAKDLNRSKLVQKIEAAIKGDKHDKILGISIKKTHVGQNWFKLYGAINNALSELRQYFFTDNTLKSGIISTAVDIGTSYMNTKRIIRNRKYSMRILLFLFLFLCINTEFRLDQTYSNSVIKTLHTALENPDDAQRFNLTITSILIFLHGTNLLYDNDKIKYPLDLKTLRPKTIPDSITTINMILNGLVMFYMKPKLSEINALSRVVYGLQKEVEVAEKLGQLTKTKNSLRQKLTNATQVTRRDLLNTRTSSTSSIALAPARPASAPAPAPAPAPVGKPTGSFCSQSSQCAKGYYCDNKNVCHPS